MATEAHIIYSHYDPQDREQLEKETGQIPDQELDPAEVWRAEASHISQRRRAPPPHFVPASFSYDEWGSKNASSSTLSDINEDAPRRSDVAEWYRSLNRSTRNNTSVHDSAASFAATSLSPAREILSSRTNPSERKNKNNWFIMKAIQSEPPSTSSSPALTLADILVRDPPPLPSEGKYTPPVWLAIGPSNKGFSMLQRSGWNEGEALGPDIIRRRPAKVLLPDTDILPTKRKGKEKIVSDPPTRREVREVKMEDYDDVSELRNVDVIDLTVSDSDFDLEESDSEFVSNIEEEVQLKIEEDNDRSLDPQETAEHQPTVMSDTSAHGRKALLTPIATVLKSDRLGIGLKAKTAGPYKASQKRVTHNAAALAAHIRAAEESRKRKKEMGRGRRGFERQRKREETSRKMMLAYLNG
ncbi:hypothetical protein BDQ12DRAFT_680117 [Crucibulum laeve]|uniref:G-patch domain-containing protein n=1 Tax=Crucibulum laeve TaxID=68775 RepID=A0A5C3MAM6_9AGAR|nr:hypothetical protein BDQ12DRAFT_680117 [Crucibulum laeve]